MKLSHKNKSHHNVNTKDLVWKVANAARDHGLQIFNSARVENAHTKPVINTIAAGDLKLRSSSLATFNKRVQVMATNRKTDSSEEDSDASSEDDLEEADELPINEVQFNWMNEIYSDD